MIAEGGGKLVPGAGYILRTAASDATPADLKEDAERLAEAWRPVMARRQSARAPATLYHDLDPVERTMRDKVRIRHDARAHRRRGRRSKPRAPIAAAPCRKPSTRSSSFPDLACCSTHTISRKRSTA